MDIQRMNYDENNLVIKANKLIQQSRFSLSVEQQRIVLYLISQIQPWDDDFKLYEFDVADFCKIIGIDYSNNNNLEYLQSTIQTLADKSLWIKIGEGKTALVRWIDKAIFDNSINAKNGKLQLRLDQDMKPFLLQLKKNYTKYELFWTLGFKSKYSIRLYELVKSLHYHEDEVYTQEFKLEELKRMIGAEHYKTFQNFKDRALIPAVNEINEKSDKDLEIQVAKNGRAYTDIKLIISTKNEKDRFILMSKLKNELGINQITIWEHLKTNKDKTK